MSLLDVIKNKLNISEEIGNIILNSICEIETEINQVLYNGKNCILQDLNDIDNCRSIQLRAIKTYNSLVDKYDRIDDFIEQITNRDYLPDMCGIKLPTTDACRAAVKDLEAIVNANMSQAFSNALDKLGMIDSSSASDIMKKHGLAWSTAAAVGVGSIRNIIQSTNISTSTGSGGSAVTNNSTPTTWTYKIQSGDTLTKIAKKYNTTVDELCRLNGISNPNLIIAGASLTIPLSGITSGNSSTVSVPQKTTNDENAVNRGTSSKSDLSQDEQNNKTNDSDKQSSTSSGLKLDTPKNPASRATPSIISDETNRSAENYTKVTQQFDVANNDRYAIRYVNGKKQTYCNIYAWDVTSAMGAEIPHWYDPATGTPTAVGEKGALEMNCNRMVDWMNDFGESYGWREVSAAEAQQAANNGHPTISLRSDHVQVVIPSDSYVDTSKTGPMVSQAGAKNFENNTAKYGFGSLSNVKYYTHA